MNATLTHENLRTETEAYYAMYILNKPTDMSNMDIEAHLYKILFGVGEMLLSEKRHTANRYLNYDDVSSIMKKDELADAEVEYALLIMCFNYIKVLVRKLVDMECISLVPRQLKNRTLEAVISKSDIILSGYYYLSAYKTVSDVDMLLPKVLKANMKRIISLVPQRYYNALTARVKIDDLSLRDTSIQLDTRDNAYNPFITGTSYKTPAHKQLSLVDTLSTLKKVTGPIHHLLQTDIDLSCIVAGGMVCNAIFDGTSAFIKDSDIDIYLLGKQSLKEERLRVIADILVKEGYTMHMIEGIITFKHDIDNDVQVIMHMFEDPMQVIANFDLSYSQVYYDGSRVMATPDFYEYSQFFYAKCCKRIAKVNRMCKAMKKGFLPVSSTAKLVGHSEITCLKYIDIGDENTYIAKTSTGYMAKYSDKVHTVEYKPIDTLPTVFPSKFITDEIYGGYSATQSDAFVHRDVKIKDTHVNYINCASVTTYETLVTIHTDKMCLGEREHSNLSALELSELKDVSHDIFYKLKYLSPNVVYFHLLMKKYVGKENIYFLFTDNEKNTYRTLSDNINIIDCMSSEDMALFYTQAHDFPPMLDKPHDFNAMRHMMRAFFNKQSRRGTVTVGAYKQMVLNYDKHSYVINGDKKESGHTGTDPIVILTQHNTCNVITDTCIRLFK